MSRSINVYVNNYIGTCIGNMYKYTRSLKGKGKHHDLKKYTVFNVSLCHLMPNKTKMWKHLQMYLSRCWYCLRNIVVHTSTVVLTYIYCHEFVKVQELRRLYDVASVRNALIFFNNNLTSMTYIYNYQVYLYIVILGPKVKFCFV